MWLFIIETPKGTSLSKSASFKMLQSCRKVLWITTQQKLGLRGTRPSPHFAQNGPIALKIPWTLSPLTCPRIPNLVRIGCTLPDLFRKDWFFSPKSNYNIGFQPAINKNIFCYISPIFPEAPSRSISTKFGIGDPLPDVINCAEFFVDRFRRIDFVGVKICLSPAIPIGTKGRR